MKLRIMRRTDYDEIATIHQKFYGEEFELPDFINNWIGRFVVTDNGGIITAGGARVIPEMMTITDKSRTSRERYDALHEILRASQLTCGIFGHEQLHAFIQSTEFENILVKVGFRPTVGQAFVIDC